MRRTLSLPHLPRRPHFHHHHHSHHLHDRRQRQNNRSTHDGPEEHDERDYPISKHAPHVPRVPRLHREKIKQVPKKAYHHTREAFRSSVVSLRRDSIDAPSLFTPAESTVSLDQLAPSVESPSTHQVGTLSTKGSLKGGRGSGEESKGRRNSLADLARKFSLRSGKGKERMGQGV